MKVRRSNDVLDHAAAVLRKFEIEPQPLDRLLERHLRRERTLNSRDRRLIAHAVFGVVRWRTRIDGWLALAGIARPTFRDRAIAFLQWQPAEDVLARELAEDRGGTARAIDCGAPMPKHFPGGEAASLACPPFLWDLLVRQEGREGAAALLTSLARPALPVLRVNAVCLDRARARELLAEAGIASEPTSRSPYGIRLRQRAELTSVAAFREGRIEVQEEASQLAAILAGPAPGETVLDACAGAGGKSLAMAMLMQDRGRIVACDIDAAKLRELARRALRARITCIEGVLANKAASRSARSFDLVFIDAPCSGTGTLRRAPDLKWRLTPQGIDEHVKAQHELLRTHASAVRPGGRLVYATCSVLRKENEEVVERFLRRGDFRVVAADEVFGRHGIASDDLVSAEGYFKADPRRGEWDGFFAALLERT
jgi:16S rRNA (cytosine967-C5)-methyltransferase